MTEKQFEAYFDEYIKLWTIRKVETPRMYPLHQKRGLINLPYF